MESRERGYDCDFVSDVPEELICVACHLVLREPVQLGECGHRLCKACANQIKSERNDRYINCCFVVWYLKNSCSKILVN